MKKQVVLLLIILIVLVSCNNSTRKKQDEKTVSQFDSSNYTNQIEEVLKTIPKNIKPVFGYRFMLSGDFNGDGKKEKLIEHFFSGIDDKETNKFYDSLSEYEQLIALTIKKEPFSFVI